MHHAPSYPPLQPMPSLQLSQEEVKCFEVHFKSAVEARTNTSYPSLLDTYIAYQNLDEHRRQRFWETVSNQTNLPRERVYKFFRFTWSRQFYSSITDHRDNIKGYVCQILDELNLPEKTPQVNSLVWSKVWGIYKDYNLHYDGLDQYVRNIVNLYFTKRNAGTPLIAPQVIELPPKPAMSLANLSKSRPKAAPAPEVPVTPQTIPAATPQPAQQVPQYDNYNYFGKVFEPEDLLGSLPIGALPFEELESVECDSYGGEFELAVSRKRKSTKPALKATHEAPTPASAIERIDLGEPSEYAFFEGL